MQLGADSEPYPYVFTYSVVIKSKKRITLISKPPNSIVDRAPDGRFATVFCGKPDREIRVCFRSDDMKYPQLLCARDPAYPEEVACTLSFVPTFEPPAPQEQFEVLEDEEPEL